jgi:hypothetical protein
MSLEGFLLFLVAAVSTMWLLWAAGRLNAAWLAAKARKQELEVKRVDLAMQLMKRGEELTRLKGADAVVTDRVATLRAHVSQKQMELASLVPPPPPEILVTSEYASSRDDKPWVVRLMSSRAGSDGTPPPLKQYLLWASDQHAAISRARNVISDEPGYEVQNVQRYV